MPLPIFRDDEELGKKDDEYKPGTRSRVWRQRGLSHIPPRRSIKRATLAILAVIALCYFFNNMLREGDGEEKWPTSAGGSLPKPHLSTQAKSTQAKLTQAKLTQAKLTQAKLSQAKSTQPAKPSPTHPVVRDFNGPIKYFELASTLYAAARRSGSSSYNQNILFAAASLKSAGILLPMACEMAIQRKNDVHFAFLGRDDISMDLLKSVNGIGKECKIMFHDARPDFAAQSTDFRMEVSCNAAFNHINKFVHPQATLIDGSGLEEHYLVAGVSERATSLERTLILLPENAERSLMWITLLDSSSLAAWHKVTVDLVIHAQPSASGSLIRLLESLKKADFCSSATPKLTIELPNNIEEATKQYLLNRFKWPPTESQNDANLLNLHHRIPQHGLTPEENSIRFLESFWPADPANSHLVVLSPQAELSPFFFHYLKYAVLEYKYSNNRYDALSLLGISLDLPRTYLNDTTTFKPPLLNNTATSFLWQAPNSNAALYFGEKWTELHDLVSSILTSQHILPKPKILGKKEVSKIYPAWLEHILKLSQTRGYVMLYPNFESVDSLVVLHNDLFQLPEEFKKEIEEASTGDLGADLKNHRSREHKEQALDATGFLSFVSRGGKLPMMADIPLIGLSGKETDWTDLITGAEEFTEVFRREIGGCGEDAKVKGRVPDKTRDLFCLDAK